TLYAEGNRRYVDTLSTYERQFVETSPKPQYTLIDNLLASIAIEQRNQGSTPRSTLGTLTEIFDYLRILFAHKAVAFCPETGERIESITKEFVADKILEEHLGQKIIILAPIEKMKQESFEQFTMRLLQKGFLRLEVDLTLYELDDEIPFSEKKKHQMALVIDRFSLTSKDRPRLIEALELTCSISNDQILIVTGKIRQFFSLSFAVASSGRSYPKLTPQSFSFNHIEGMCPTCKGLAEVRKRICSDCKGSRLNTLSRLAELEEHTLFDLTTLPLTELSYFLDNLPNYPLLEEA
ncbi:unnamed protein product, partial [marine sediment metagenome]